jgi:2-methylcitrate dehydratase PrpD
MTANVTEKVADFIAHLEYSHITAEAVDAAKESLLDFLGVAIAGYRNQRLNKLLMDYVLQIDRQEESTILGNAQKVSAPHAALINGTSGHCLDLDDGHRQALGHPGVCVVPAALALGEPIGASGKQILAAIVAGYEIFIRIGKSMNPALFSRGFHTTGVCGTLAAAASAAKILSLDHARTGDTLGIAATQSAGLLIVIHSGQMMKPINAGKAAYNGVLSAILSQRGANGPQNVLEDKDGFGQAFAGDWEPAVILDELGQRFSITESYRKLYPACRHSHAAIDAALSLIKTGEFSVDQIAEIKVTTYPAALKLTRKTQMPEDEPGTRFNLAFAVSLALAKGRAGLSDFSMASIKDRHIRQLFDKVQFISDPSFESREENFRGAQVEITLSDNTVVKHKVLLPTGEPEKPAGSAELEDKFKSCIGDFWTEKKTEKVMQAIRNLEQIENIGEFTQLIREN